MIVSVFLHADGHGLGTRLDGIHVNTGFNKVRDYGKWPDDPDFRASGKAPALPAIILALAGLGILIAALAKNETQAGVVTILIALAMAVVSGCASPDIQLPGISFVTPNYWALLGMKNIIARGMGWDGVLWPGAVLLGMALVCFIIGAMRFKFE